MRIFVGNDIFEPVVASAQVEIEIVGPDRDGIGVRQCPTVAVVAVNDNEVRLVGKLAPNLSILVYSH